MKLILPAVLAAASFVMISAGSSSAAVSQQAIDNVLAKCPIEARIGRCSSGVADFVTALGPNGTSRDVLTLARALENAAKHPQITLPMCKEIEKAIRLSAKAVTEPAANGEIKRIADELCERNRFVGAGGNDSANDTPPYTPPPSLGDPAPTPQRMIYY